ncbi:hypothetical protein [Elioraea sp.]|uniref:hypothetical protein n=1 Tax=Elioraea sp. TaxID=2185103 RepID=UPI003F7107D1
MAGQSSLELSRLGRRPIARLLSTQAALDPEVQAAAWTCGRGRLFAAEGARLGLRAPRARMSGRPS